MILENILYSSFKRKGCGYVDDKLSVNSKMNIFNSIFLVNHPVFTKIDNKAIGLNYMCSSLHYELVKYSFISITCPTFDN